LSFNDLMKIRYGKVCKMTRERILKDHWRKRFGEEENDIEKNSKDPKECGEDKANTVMGVIYDKLNNDWFNGTNEDEDDLEGILYYLKPSAYNGFIDLKVIGIDEMARTRDNVASIRARLMEKIANEGNGHAKT
nr:hypothetical protein [Tanacetum cinerariifolium]